MEENPHPGSSKTIIQRSWILVLFFALSIEVCFLSIAVIWWFTNQNTKYSPSNDRLAEISTATINNFPTASLEQTMPLTHTPTDNPSSTPTNTQKLTNTPVIPNIEVSPPGKIVYTCFDGNFDQICIMNANGTGKRQLTFANATSFYPSLSPDGDQIVFSSKRGGAFDIYIMDSQGGDQVPLTNGIGNLYAPEISTKGNRILFTAETGGIQSVWVMKINGQNARPLIDSSGSDIDPTWSPDASQIAFTSQRDGNQGIFVAEADGSKPRGITPRDLINVGRSSWSPLGFWLAFYAGSSGAHEIYTIGTDGKNLTQLTSGGDNLAPSYSPDGKWLAFTSFRDGNNEIYIMSLSDLRVYRLTNNPHPDWQARWGP